MKGLLKPRVSKRVRGFVFLSTKRKTSDAPKYKREAHIKQAFSTQPDIVIKRRTL